MWLRVKDQCSVPSMVEILNKGKEKRKTRGKRKEGKGKGHGRERRGKDSLDKHCVGIYYLKIPTAIKCY